MPVQYTDLQILRVAAICFAVVVLTAVGIVAWLRTQDRWLRHVEDAEKLAARGKGLIDSE